jgi:hypothetical protein
MKPEDISAKDIVRERYPSAQAQYHEAVYQIGQKASTQPGYWAIYRAGGLGHQPIGTGPSEEAAWVSASEEVLKGLRQPTGLRITREMLQDAEKVGAGVLPVEEIEAALDAGRPVIVDEMDGSESLLERGEGGRYRMTRRPPP